MKNPIRAALARGDTVTGIILFSGSPMITELAAAAGVDFVIIDMEHSALDLDGCAHVIRAADAAGITPFVRVPEVDAALIQKILNLGACAIVRSARYAPGDWADHVQKTNNEVMVIPLVEDRATLEDFDALAAIPGLEVFFIGPTDLSIALGVPQATFDEPAMAAALDRVVAAARRHGKHVMTSIGNQPDAAYGRAVAARGVRAIVLGTDGHLFLDACRRLDAVKRPS